MPRKKTIRDEDLLNAARDCFVERGFAVSTKEISVRAGVSEGLLFQRYGTKADLFFAAMVPPQTDLTALLAKPLDEEHFIKLGFTMLDYFRKAVPVLLPLMSHPAFRFEDFAERNPDSPLVTLRRQAVHFFIDSGAPDPSASALLLISSVFGVCMFERLGAHGGTMPPEFVTRMLRRIWQTSTS